MCLCGPFVFRVIRTTNSLLPLTSTDRRTGRRGFWRRQGFAALCFLAAGRAGRLAAADA